MLTRLRTLHLPLPFRALLVALIALFAIGLPTLAQETAELPLLDEPTVQMLSTAAGLAIVVALITNLLRGTMPAGVFDKWGPTIAVIVGMALGLLGLLAANGPLTTGTVVQAFLVGAFGGYMSQNVNTQAKRAVSG